MKLLVVVRKAPPSYPQGWVALSGSIVGVITLYPAVAGPAASHGCEKMVVTISSLTAFLPLLHDIPDDTGSCVSAVAPPPG